MKGFLINAQPNRLVLITIICLVIAVAFTYFNRYADRGRRIVSQPREILPRGDLADFEKSTITIFKSAAPSVVYIFTENAQSGFFGRREIQQGAGSGFLWDRHGHMSAVHRIMIWRLFGCGACRKAYDRFRWADPTTWQWARRFLPSAILLDWLAH
jgi:hypothetical protein